MTYPDGWEAWETPPFEVWDYLYPVKKKEKARLMNEITPDGGRLTSFMEDIQLDMFLGGYGFGGDVWQKK